MIGNAGQATTWMMRFGDPDKLFDVQEHKEKRGAKANRYFHRLVGLLAKGEKSRFYAKKNELIMQYGNHEFEREKDGTLKYEYLNDDDEYKSDPVKHYCPTRYTDTFRGRQIRAFCLFKGTHTYNSAEMAHLIDCTRDECAGCDIPWEEIETLDEKRLMQELRNNTKA